MADRGQRGSSAESTQRLVERGRRVLPGGVTANARVNKALGRPFYIERGDGPFIFDDQNRRYIDLCTSNGATLLGHGHPAIKEAIARATERGLVCAYDGASQIELAEKLVDTVPSLEMVRFTTTGTEATHYALRVARAATGRTKVMKFEGHFHGYNDALAFSFWPSLEEGGDERRPTPTPETTGLPDTALSQIVIAPFNDSEGFLRLVRDHSPVEGKSELAAVIMEPINYDAGAIMPDPTFLQTVRDETRRRGIVLIFDEILSGYRTGLDLAQGYLGVTPDLTTIGKALGGGTPLSAFGGRADLMSFVSPLGGAVHTGTYNAHLIPVLASLAFLDQASRKGFFERLVGQSDRLRAGLQRGFDSAGVPCRVQGIGARFAFYFGLPSEREVTRYRQAAKLDWKLLNGYCRQMLKRGVFVNPAWHHGICGDYTPEIVDEVIEQSGAAAYALATEGD